MNVLPYTSNDKIKLYSYLKKIYGLNHASITSILKKLGFDFNYKFYQLNSIDKKKLTEMLFQQGLLIEIDLKKKIFDSIKNQKNIRTYQGLRHRLNLPVRGQNTKNNAKTQK